MRSIFKYLGEHKAAVLLIILFLIVEAWCDLSLPQYTSDIVDVGIQQGGIENAALDQIRQSSFDDLSLFMTQKEIATFKECYDLDTDSADVPDDISNSGDTGDSSNIYKMNQTGADNIDELNDILSVPMVMVSYMAESEQDGLRQLSAMKDAGMLTDEDILQIRESALEQMGDINGSITSQIALAYVKNEYEAIGVDTGAIQTSYLLKTGGIMLFYSLIMMLAAIVVSLIASRTSAAIGRDLRGRVFKKVVSFSNRETDQFSTASLITRSTNDIQQVQMVCVMLLRMVLYAPVLGIGGIIKVSGTRTGMSWIIAVAVVAIVLLVSTLMAIALPKFKILQTLVDRMNLVSREILTGIPVIRAFSREKHEEARFEDANRNLMKTQLFTDVYKRQF